MYRLCHFRCSFCSDRLGENVDAWRRRPPINVKISTGKEIKRIDRIIPRYVFAVLAAVLALVLTCWANSKSRNTLFDLFQGAVVLSAWYGGFGPGILTSTLSILALDYFFIPPLYTLQVTITDLLRLVIFGAVAFLTSSLSDRLKRAKADLERWSRELEARVFQRTEELSRVNKTLSAEIVQRTEAEKAILEISNREQRRLSEDLHDGLCQLLAVIKLLSEDVKEKLSARGAPEMTQLELIESRLGEALEQADNISRGLYPVDLETHGLMEALQELANKVPKIYPVECRFKCWEPVLVENSTVATHLYRIAQEAIINAIKSGKAKRITIRLQARGTQGVLSISDNGVGFHSSGTREGMGIKMMNFRARMILASLAFRSGSIGGTVVRCRFQMQGHLSELENPPHANI